MAIGAASLIKTLFFTIIIPKYFNYPPIYPSMATILILFVVVIYGIHIGKIIEPEKPKPVKNCKSD
jgi:hypothetical protein